MSTLIVVVGENPTENYLAIRTINPEYVLLVFSAERKEAHHRLRMTLLNENSVKEHHGIFTDFTCPTEIARSIRSAIHNARQMGASELMLTHSNDEVGRIARAAFEQGDYIHEVVGDEWINAAPGRVSFCEGNVIHFGDGTSKETVLTQEDAHEIVARMGRAS